MTVQVGEFGIQDILDVENAVIETAVLVTRRLRDGFQASKDITGIMSDLLSEDMRAHLSAAIDGMSNIPDQAGDIKGEEYVALITPVVGAAPRIVREITGSEPGAVIGADTQVGEHGIKDLHEVIVAILEISVLLTKLLKDGVQVVDDSSALISEIMLNSDLRDKVSAAMDGISNVGSQAADLSGAEWGAITMPFAEYAPRIVGAIINK